MLYERWREVARANAGETALVDLATGRSWTFAQLAAASEASEASEGRGWCFPRGRGAGFVLDVLSAWRAGRVVCPLEEEQDAGVKEADLPAGIVHVKRTSATTGPARSILFTASQLAQDAANIVRSMGLNPEVPNLGVISLAHSYGFSNLVLPLLLHGVPLYLVDSPIPERLRHFLGLRARWALPAVPALWRTWVEADLPDGRIALAISAGAPLPLTLEVEAFERHGLKIHNFYGASECGGIAFDDSSTPRQDGSMAGRPLHGVQVSVGRDDCLEVEGAAVGTGYWPREATGVLGAGRYVTRDLGNVTEGWVRLSGRAGDLINVSGRKVSPERLESLLLNGPGIQDCLVFGVERPGSGRGEEIVICYVSNVPSDDGMEKRCRQWAAARLPAWQVPRHWWRVKSLGNNERGKRSRKEWRERFIRERG